MKNADKPAFPLDYDAELNGNKFKGLTKREYFAGLAMQGFISTGTGYDKEYLAHKSIEAADELLEQLENSNTKNQDDRN